MLLTLRDLQRTMDPLIAAQVYNNNCNPLGRLPEELLLHILHCLGDDILTLYCLRRVSRRFRRLIYQPDIWKYMLLPLSRRFMSTTEASWDLPVYVKEHLRRHLQRDGMCDKCILWCDVSVKGWFRQFIQASNLHANRPQIPWGFCKFEYPLRPSLYCDACGIHQDVQAFSSSNQQPYKRERRCLGRQGAVQLCEHVHVSWAAVEAHIADWQQRKPGDWQACFDHFDIECHDPSHDTRCTAEEAPTWPRVRLQSAAFHPNLVVLNLEWKPHSGLDAFTRTPDGRAPASELRELFQRYRQGPAGILLPSYPSNPLPEMTCFDTTKCICLHYEMGANKKSSAANPPRHASFFRDDWRSGCHAYHYLYRGHGVGGNGGRVDMSKHWPRGMRNSVCLVTTYQRDVLICHKTNRTKINPTHDWFHAMDPDTYPRPYAGHALPLCKDKDCMNYYRRPRSLRCN